MFEYLWSYGTARKQTPVKRRLTPRVEMLEDRCVPTVAIAEFPVTSASAAPYGITAGPDGNMWFTENQADHIGMINPTTHAISEFAIPTASSAPMGITAGPDGNLWFTEFSANQIGMINPTTHVVSQFPIPTGGSDPAWITAGPDGNLWFTEFKAGQIGMINPTTGVVTEFPLLTAGSGPMGITAGPDGNIWFTEANAGNIGTINPTLHTVNEYAIPDTGTQPYQIVTGANGAMWFTENAGNRIGEIIPSTFGFANSPILTGSSGPYGITSGPDGNIWYVESTAGKVGEIAMVNGSKAEAPLPTSAATPIGISAGPGGTLWFTESSGNQIGEVVEAPIIQTAPSNATVVEGKTATFSATAAGFPAPSVQWEMSTNGGATFLPVINAGVYSGANTDTLTITGVTQGMSGFRFEAVFGNGVSPTPSVTTSSAVLTVKPVLSITPALPQGIVGASYNQTLTIVGSTTPINVITVTNFNGSTTGLTQDDITMDLTSGTIAISGTPTAAGAATFTVTAANAAGNTLTQNLTITIRPPLSIATTSLPQATAGTLYNQTITAAGGILPYTAFNVTNFSGGGTGLTAANIAAHGLTGIFNVVGTPTAAGSATFTVNVTDSASNVVSQDFTIIVNPALTITPTLPAGTSGTVYNQTITVSGGGVPYSSLTVSPFNAGGTGLTVANLTINAAGGTIVINGTPAAAGTLSFTVNVVDAIGATLTKSYAVTIHPGLAITSSLPQGTVGVSYQHTLTVTGGATPYASIVPGSFSAGGTGLAAANVTVNPTAATIVVSGTPTAVGTATFTVSVTDAAGSTLTQHYTITINAAPTIGSLTTTQWTVGKSAFTGTMTINGGTGPFSIASSGLPTGMTAVVSGNTISFGGAPTAPGIFAAGSIVIHDAAGAVATKTFSITINVAPTIGNLTASQWTIGKSGFNGVMAATGGTGGLSVVSSAGLPPGLTLALNGNAISFTGTPTAFGTFNGSVALRDAIGATVVKTFAITINAQPAVGVPSTTQWTVGKAGFLSTLAIVGGTGPFVLAGVSGLPTGLTAVLSGNQIRIIGTPTTALTFAAGTITIHDAAGASVTKTFSITVNPPLQFTTTSVPASTMAALYTASLHINGGTGAVTYAITAGSLPPGIQLSKAGVITGVSRGFGVFTFTVTATDAVGAAVSEKFTLMLAF